MKWLKQFVSRLFKRNNTMWDTLDYGKPSTAGDEARRMREG